MMNTSDPEAYGDRRRGGPGLIRRSVSNIIHKLRKKRIASNLQFDCGQEDNASASESFLFARENELHHDDRSPTYNNGSCMVMECMRWNATSVTIKRLHRRPNPSARTLNQLQRECLQTGRLRHPNILLLMSLCPTSGPERFVLIYEPVEVGSLYQVVHGERYQLDSRLLGEMVAQICSALFYIHSRGFVHRALSSHAVQICSGNTPKLSNLEFVRPITTGSCEEENTRPANEKLEPEHIYVSNWMAPEILLHKDATTKSDLYSLCCIIWEVIHLEVPWAHVPINTITSLAEDSELKLPVEDWILSPFDQILSIGLDPEPNSRMSCVSKIQEIMVVYLFSTTSNRSFYPTAKPSDAMVVTAVNWQDGSGNNTRDEDKEAEEINISAGSHIGENNIIEKNIKINSEYSKPTEELLNKLSKNRSAETRANTHLFRNSPEMEDSIYGMEVHISGTEGSASGTEGSASGTKGSVSGTKGSVSGTKEIVSGTKDIVTGTKYIVSGTKDSVSKTNASVFRTKDSVSGTKDNVSGTKDSVSGTKDNVSGTKDSVSGTKGGVFGTNDNNCNATNSSEYEVDDEECETDAEGYETDSGGCETDSGGCETGSAECETDCGGRGTEYLGREAKYKQLRGSRRKCFSERMPSRGDISFIRRRSEPGLPLCQSCLRKEERNSLQSTQISTAYTTFPNIRTLTKVHEKLIARASVSESHSEPLISSHPDRVP